MELKSKTMKFTVIFLILLIGGGVLLMYKGHDAIALALEKKDGILTAEQVKMSFDSVSGRLVNEAVRESQEVKKGDILMVLDSTDVDLSIEKTKAQIAQLDAQIGSTHGAIGVGFAKAANDEQQDFRQIDQQRALVDAAQATYANKQLDYGRKAALYDTGAISRSDLDACQTELDVAAANATAQQQMLAKLLSGARDSGDTDSLALPTIAQERQEAANKQFDADALVQQKKQLEVQLKELEVKKERLILRAPEDGKVLKIIAKQGEMVAANTPVILLESKRYYYDIYLNEQQAANLSEGSEVAGHTVANNLRVSGIVRSIAQAPGFADLKMSREKGQADLAAFQIRIYVEPQDKLRPGMTVEVTEHEFAAR